MKAPTTGRPSLFRGKDLTRRVTPYMTPTGYKRWDEARKRLAELVGWAVKDIKDGDVGEYLARGHKESVAYLKKTGQIAA